MSENYELIAAANLPTTDAKEVDVICVEGGELKRKPGASLGGASSWNDLTDKPFGNETRINVLPETTLTFDSGSESGIEEPLPASAIIGEMHIVNWNGTDYRCIAQPFDMGGMPVAVLGDLGAVSGGASTGEPFVFMQPSPEAAAMLGFYAAIVALDGSTEANMSIVCLKVDKIPENLLPFGDSKFLIKATGNIGDEENWTADKSFMEAYSAASAGKMVMLHVGNAGMSWVYHLTSIWSSGALGFVCPLGGGNAYSVYYIDGNVFSDNLD
jgi:hypothetical protein